MPTTIYVSGSISGGRQDAGLYRRIVAHLVKEGHRVLAGAVAAESISAGGEDLGERAIFERDLAWIAEAAAAGGVLVADVSMPSIGVGYEIGAARYRFRIPVICLYRPAFTRRCSGMIAGDREIQLIEYTGETVSAAIEKLLAAVANKRPTRTV